MDRQASALVDAARQGALRQLIDGEWVDGQGPRTAVRDKYTLQPFAELTQADEAQTRRALIEQTWRLVRDVWPAAGRLPILPVPLREITAIRVFDADGALAHFEGFASIHGPAFYGLPLNEERITLRRAETKVPASLPAAGTQVVPFKSGETLAWAFDG